MRGTEAKGEDGDGDASASGTEGVTSLTWLRMVDCEPTSSAHSIVTKEGTKGFLFMQQKRYAQVFS